MIGLLDDIIDDPESLVDLPEPDKLDVLAYATGVAAAHDEWALVNKMVQDFIQDDTTTEADISRVYQFAQDSMEKLDALRRDAVSPAP